MDAIVLNIISSIIYSVITKSGTFVKQKFIESMYAEFRIQNPQLLEQVADEIDALELDDEMSEKLISRQINESNTLQQLFQKIDINKSQIIQNHSGSGDNVAGDKTEHNYKG